MVRFGPWDDCNLGVAFRGLLPWRAPRCSTIPTGDTNNLPRAKKLEAPVEPGPMWLEAVKAAEEKQAKDILILDLRDISSFADYFVICSGSNSKQLQAIADGIQMHLKKLGEQANGIEG